MKLTKDELFKCLVAVDNLIKKWENFGVEISDEWYILREKLINLSQRDSC